MPRWTGWWVETSTSRHVTFDRKGGRSIGYGYWWWIQEPDPRGSGVPIVAAHGFRGQYIFLIEEHDMIVVVTGGAHGADMRKPVDFLYTHILPAVRRADDMPAGQRRSRQSTRAAEMRESP